MDAFDADLLGEPAPFLTRLRFLELEANVAGDIEQRLLDEPGHQARLGAAAADRGGAAGLARALGRHGGLAQGVVRARLRPELGVKIEAGPRLVDGVDVERADLVAQFLSLIHISEPTRRTPI